MFTFKLKCTASLVLLARVNNGNFVVLFKYMQLAIIKCMNNKSKKYVFNTYETY